VLATIFMPRGIVGVATSFSDWFMRRRR